MHHCRRGELITGSPTFEDFCAPASDFGGVAPLARTIYLRLADVRRVLCEA